MIWKDIKEFDGYQVSDTGLVRTHNKITFTKFNNQKIYSVDGDEIYII